MSRFTNILFVATPDSDDGHAFRRILELAELHRARLTVVVTQPDPGAHMHHGLDTETLRRVLVESSAETLGRYTETAGDRVELHTETLFGVSFVEIIRTVMRNGHDLVVKRAHEQESGSARLFGSLDMHLLRKCQVPLWIMKPIDHGPYRRILAAVDFDVDRPVPDGDSLNRRILEAAAAQALADSAELHVVHAWQPAFEGILRSRGVLENEEAAQQYVDGERQSHRRMLDDLLARLHDWIGTEACNFLQPGAHLRQGPAARAIPELAKDIDAELVVMGTVGRTGIPGLLIGNTAESILDALECSVLAVKPPGFITPVRLAER